MSFWDGVPIVSQMRSRDQAERGDVEGAIRTQETFIARCPIVSQVASVIDMARGDTEKASERHTRFMKGLFSTLTLNFINFDFPPTGGKPNSDQQRTPHYEENVKVYESMRPGDIISFRHGLHLPESQMQFYRHVGVHIGEGMIVHVFPDYDRFMTDLDVFLKGQSKFDSVGFVIIKTEHFWDVAKLDKTRIYNVLDKQITPFGTDDIIDRAKSRVGEKWPYNFLKHNCEHFANWCRYGDYICVQAADTRVALLEDHAPLDEDGSYTGHITFSSEK